MQSVGTYGVFDAKKCCGDGYEPISSEDEQQGLSARPNKGIYAQKAKCAFSAYAESVGGHGQSMP